MNSLVYTGLTSKQPSELYAWLAYQLGVFGSNPNRLLGVTFRTLQTESKIMTRLSTVQCLSKTLATKVLSFMQSLKCGVIIRDKGLEFGMIGLRVVGKQLFAVCECSTIIPITLTCIRRNWESFSNLTNHDSILAQFCI